MVSLAFEPINRIHSLVEMVLVIEFPASIPAGTLQRAKTLKREFSSILPRVEDVHAFQMLVENGVTRSGQMIEGGFQMSSFKNDGTVAAMARISENVISVHWLQYERWEGARIFVQKTLAKILERVRGGGLAPTSIGLKFIDQFVCLDEAKYDAKQLFQTENGYIARDLFSVGSRWHSHTGQFVGELGGDELLMQLNVDSSRQQNADTSRVMVQVDNTYMLRSSNPGSLTPYIAYSGTGPEWTSLLNEMHDRNKTLLKTILHDSIQRRIGLVRDGGSEKK